MTMNPNPASYCRYPHECWRPPKMPMESPDVVLSSTHQSGLTPRPKGTEKKTFPTTRENPNVQAVNCGDISIPTTACHLSPKAAPNWNRVQSLSRRFLPEPELCVEVSRQYLAGIAQSISQLHVLAPSPPERQRSHFPRGSFTSRGLDCQGLCLLPDAHCPPTLTVPPADGGPTGSAKPPSLRW